MSKNMKRLGATLSNRMKRTANGAVPTAIELGVVNPNLSITTDSLQASIPKGDYMINLMFAGGEFRGLQSGDRILVAWCGNEPVVVAIVVSS